MAVSRIIDTAPLNRLLHLAGAADAPILVTALLGDLRANQTNLDQAWNGPDFAALHTNSHVLIALAGTIGDTDLHALAQRLNTAAHLQSLGDIMDMKSKIMAGLADLITLISRLSISKGP